MTCASSAHFFAACIRRLRNDAHTHHPSLGCHWWSLAFGDACLQQLSLHRPNVRSMFVTSDAITKVYIRGKDSDVSSLLPIIEVRARRGMPIPVTQFTMVTNSRCVLSAPDLHYMDVSPYSVGFACVPHGSHTATGYRVGGRITTGAFGAVLLDERNQLATLGDFTMGACAMAGMTSDAPAAFMSQWPLLSSLVRDKVPVVHQSASTCNRLTRVIDGFVVDNSGIYGLLARKVQNVVMIIYAEMALEESVHRSLSTLFGHFTEEYPFIVPTGSKAQIFDAALYDVVISALRASMLGGTRTGFATFRSLDVMGNAKHGIPAYTLQSLTIVYPGRDDVFLMGIPKETRDALLLDRPRFPHYPLIDVSNAVRLRFMSTVGANGLARYAQYIGETYVVPNLRIHRPSVYKQCL